VKGKSVDGFVAARNGNAFEIDSRQGEPTGGPSWCRRADKPLMRTGSDHGEMTRGAQP
jgi:hypothetical protein